VADLNPLSRAFSVIGQEFPRWWQDINQRTTMQPVERGVMEQHYGGPRAQQWAPQENREVTFGDVAGDAFDVFAPLAFYTGDVEAAPAAKVAKGKGAIGKVVNAVTGSKPMTAAEKDNALFRQLLGKSPEAQGRRIETAARKHFAVPEKEMRFGPPTEEAWRTAKEKARGTAERELKWNLMQRPEAEKNYGPLVRSRFDDTAVQRLQNTPEAVEARAARTEQFLSQPAPEPWVAREYAFERAPIKDALEGWPGREQTRFERYKPSDRTDLSYIDEIYTDPRNRNFIKRQIERGLPLGGETFYASLWPVATEAMSRGIPREQVENWIQSVAPGSARNSIYNEVAVGNLLKGMNARGVPLTRENVQQEMARFRKQYGVGLPLMDVHRSGSARVLEMGQSLRDRLLAPIRLASDAPEYKIPTYGVQRSGDFGKSWVGDVHEARGETLGSKYHPYFTEQGGFNALEYGRAEDHMLDIAGEMGIPGGMAQAGRWFGGGEMTGLLSPRGDALDMLERQAAFTLQKTGQEVTPKSVRDFVMGLIERGGDVMPWQSKKPMPDYR
jgi:hypothetical protein